MLDAEIKELLEELGGNPLLREKIREWRGRPANYTGNGMAVLKMSSPIRDTIFEWHPQTRKVFYVELTRGADGTITSGTGYTIAFNIETHGDAENARLIWLRGYEKGQSPSVPQTRLMEGT